MRVAFRIVFSDIHGSKLRHSTYDHCNVVNDDVSALITLEQEELASLFIVVGVNCRYGHLLINAHIVKLRHELLVADVWLEGRR